MFRKNSSKLHYIAPEFEDLGKLVNSEYYSDLSPVLKLAKINKIQESANTVISNLKRSAVEELTEQAAENNPNYIHHQFTSKEANYLINFIDSKLNQLNLYNYDQFSLKSTINQAWTSVSKGKHPQWLKAVKHRKTSHVFQSPKTKTNNQHLSDYCYIKYQKLKIQFMEQLLKERNSEITKLKLEVNQLLANQNNQIPRSISTWKRQVIVLKKQGHSIKEICFRVNKGRTSVSTFLNSAEGKKYLNSI